MNDYQTPQKEQSRPSNLGNHRSKESQLKKSQTLPKKSLNAAFKTVSFGSSPDITKEPVDCSPISEISDANSNGEIDESLVLTPALLSPSRPFNLSGLTPSSTSRIAAKSEVSNPSPTHHEVTKSNGPKIGSLKADVLANLLKEAGSQVSNSIDVEAKSKKLLDALINFVVDEFYKIPEDKDRFSGLISMKARVVITCLMIWILALSLVFFFALEPQPSFIGTLPT